MFNLIQKILKRDKIPRIIDLKTKNLLQELRKDYQINFHVWNKSYAEVYQKNKKAIIYYNPFIANTESIAHELLHIWLNRFNYEIGNHIYHRLASEHPVNKIFDKDLCNHISNVFDHLKMYPKYIQMGYSCESFLLNSMSLKSNYDDLKKINLNIEDNFYAISINLFIGNLFSILADHVENDYNNHHQILFEKEPDLYSIICKYWENWNKFDIEKNDPINNSSFLLTTNFIEDMLAWADGKKIL